jgi:RNA polymerase sigma-70 factor, ECF subfamily
MVDYSALKDEEVLARLQAGESWAMSVLYDRYARLVFSLALKVLNDREVAEEVVQEVFVKVWRRAGDYHVERGKFSSWLGGIAQHHAIDELRRRSVRPSAAGDENAAADVADDEPAPYERAVQSIEHQQITDALKCIPDEQRYPIELAYFEGLTQQQIADRLQQPLGTIKTRMRLGMQKLKTLLEPKR